MHGWIYERVFYKHNIITVLKYSILKLYLKNEQNCLQAILQTWVYSYSRLFIVSIYCALVSYSRWIAYPFNFWPVHSTCTSIGVVGGGGREPLKSFFWFQILDTAKSEVFLYSDYHKMISNWQLIILCYKLCDYLRYIDCLSTPTSIKTIGALMDVRHSWDRGLNKSRLFNFWQ